MALESKPLFHPEVLRQQVRAFELPPRVAEWQPKLKHWASLIGSGRADDFNETELLPDFLGDVFCGLLGYSRPAGTADTFTFSRERYAEVDGQFADAVLGRFQKERACHCGDRRQGHPSRSRPDVENGPAENANSTTAWRIKRRLNDN